MAFSAGAAAIAVAAIGAGGALANTCPNSSTKTVTGTPSYTYTRGCIVSYDGTAIVYNLFEPLNPAPDSVYPIMEGPGWGGAGRSEERRGGKEGRSRGSQSFGDHRELST